MLQVDQLQSDLEANKNQAVEREEMAGKQISALKLQIQEQQERLLASEKSVSAIAELPPVSLGGKSDRQRAPTLSCCA